MFLVTMSLIVPLLATGEVSQSWVKPDAALRASLDRKVEAINHALVLTEPDWILERTEAWEHQTFIHWKPRAVAETPKREAEGSGGSRSPDVQVQVFPLATPEDAAKRLAAVLPTISVAPSRKAEEIGDECYVWGGKGAGVPTTLRLRSGSFMVWISGPSAEISERFARQIVEVLRDDKMK